MAWLPDRVLDLLVRLLEWADEKVEFAIFNKHVKKWHKKLHE
jgi:hypothetical protein